MRLVRQQFAISMEEFAPVVKKIREVEALWRMNSGQISIDETWRTRWNA